MKLQTIETKAVGKTDAAAVIIRSTMGLQLQIWFTFKSPALILDPVLNPVFNLTYRNPGDPVTMWRAVQATINFLQPAMFSEKPGFFVITDLQVAMLDSINQ